MEHILLIEDNLPDAELIKTFLEDASFPYRLYKAKSLQDGLDIIRYNPIDLVLLDLGLDDSTGLSTLNLFFEEVPNIPVVVLTGNSNELLGMNAIRVGAQDLLVKGDFTSKQLLRAMRHSMLRHKKQCELFQENWKLKQQEKQRMLLLNSVKLGSWELDFLDNTMVWSVETHQILGSNPESLPPKLSDYLRLVAAEDKDRVTVFFENAGKRGEPFELEHRAVINNRIVKYLYLRGQIQSLDASGKILLVGSIQDITDLRRTEGKEIDPAAFFSKDASAFFTSVAPLMRDPLLSLLHTIDQLEMISSMHQRNLIKNARNSMAELGDAVVQQLNMVMLTKLELSPKKEIIQIVDWQQVIEDIFRTKCAKPGIKCELKWDISFPDLIHTDRLMLNVLIYNVLDGLLECHEAKSKLAVSFEWKATAQAQCSLHLVFHAPGNPNIVEKRKAWIGTFDQALQKLDFMPAEGSHSLNIQVLARIVSCMNGALTIDKNGQIELNFPVDYDKEENVRENKLLTRPIRILVVENQSIIQIALRRMLLSYFQDMELNYADNLADGNEKLNMGEYDLMLINAQILGENVDQIFTNPQSIPIIALSSDCSGEKKTVLLEAGAVECIANPPRREELLSVVRKVLNN